MNRGDLVDTVRRSMELWPGDVVDIVLGELLRVALARAAAGEKTSLGGLGYFSVATIAARPYVVPVKNTPIDKREPKSRFIFIASKPWQASLTGEEAAPSSRRYGRDELLDAAVLACDEMDEARRKSLNDAGVLCRMCDGDGAAGRGAWVRGDDGAWACASGEAPFLALHRGDVELMIDYVEAAIKSAIAAGGVVTLRGVGEWYVGLQRGRVVSVPVRGGGRRRVDCQERRVIQFTAFARP